MICRLSNDVKASIRTGVALTSFAQAVEEMVLNSIDAAASSVAVRIDLPCFKVQVVDNGQGITGEQFSLIGERYSTSKCHTVEDLEHLNYFGYRGEALASLRAAASFMEIESKSRMSSMTYSKCFQNGQAMAVRHSIVPRPSPGTTVTVHGLFYNLPVRRKQLNEILEMERIRYRLAAIALIWPQISISIRDDSVGHVVLQTRKCNGMASAFSQIFTPARVRCLMDISGEQDEFKLSGIISKESYARKDLQFVFINKRLVLKSSLHKQFNKILGNSLILRRKGLGKEMSEKVTSTLGNGKNTNGSPSKQGERFCIFAINVQCPFNAYDITFDPAKTLVEFKDWPKLIHFVQDVFYGFLRREDLLCASEPSMPDSPPGMGNNNDNVDENKGELKNFSLVENLTINEIDKTSASDNLNERCEQFKQFGRLSDTLSSNAVFSKSVCRPQQMEEQIVEAEAPAEMIEPRRKCGDLEIGKAVAQSSDYAPLSLSSVGLDSDDCSRNVIVIDMRCESQDINMQRQKSGKSEEDNDSNMLVGSDKQQDYLENGKANSTVVTRKEMHARKEEMKRRDLKSSFLQNESSLSYSSYDSEIPLVQRRKDDDKEAVLTKTQETFIKSKKRITLGSSVPYSSTLQEVRDAHLLKISNDVQRKGEIITDTLQQLRKSTHKARKKLGDPYKTPEQSTRRVCEGNTSHLQNKQQKQKLIHAVCSNEFTVGKISQNEQISCDDERRENMDVEVAQPPFPNIPKEAKGKHEGIDDRDVGKKRKSPTQPNESYTSKLARLMRGETVHSKWSDESPDSEQQMQTKHSKLLQDFKYSRQEKRHPATLLGTKVNDNHSSRDNVKTKNIDSLEVNDAEKNQCDLTGSANRVVQSDEDLPFAVYKPYSKTPKLSVVLSIPIEPVISSNTQGNRGNNTTSSVMSMDAVDPESVNKIIVSGEYSTSLDKNYALQHQFKSMTPEQSSCSWNNDPLQRATHPAVKMRCSTSLAQESQEVKKIPLASTSCTKHCWSDQDSSSPCLSQGFCLNVETKIGGSLHVLSNNGETGNTEPDSKHSCKANFEAHQTEVSDIIGSNGFSPTGRDDLSSHEVSQFCKNVAKNPEKGDSALVPIDSASLTTLTHAYSDMNKRCDESVPSRFDSYQFSSTHTKTAKSPSDQSEVKQVLVQSEISSPVKFNPLSLDEINEESQDCNIPAISCPNPIRDPPILAYDTLTYFNDYNTIPETEEMPEDPAQMLRDGQSLEMPLSKNIRITNLDGEEELQQIVSQAKQSFEKMEKCLQDKKESQACHGSNIGTSCDLQVSNSRMSYDPSLPCGQKSWNSHPEEMGVGSDSFSFPFLCCESSQSKCFRRHINSLSSVQDGLTSLSSVSPTLVMDSKLKLTHDRSQRNSRSESINCQRQFLPFSGMSKNVMPTLSRSGEDSARLNDNDDTKSTYVSSYELEDTGDNNVISVCNKGEEKEKSLPVGISAFEVKNASLTTNNTEATNCTKVDTSKYPHNDSLDNLSSLSSQTLLILDAMEEKLTMEQTKKTFESSQPILDTCLQHGMAADQNSSILHGISDASGVKEDAPCIGCKDESVRGDCETVVQESADSTHCSHLKEKKLGPESPEAQKTEQRSVDNEVWHSPAESEDKTLDALKQNSSPFFQTSLYLKNDSTPEHITSDSVTNDWLCESNHQIDSNVGEFARKQEGSEQAVWQPVIHSRTGKTMYVNSLSLHYVSFEQWSELPSQEQRDRLGVTSKDSKTQSHVPRDLSAAEKGILHMLVKEHEDEEDAEALSKWRGGRHPEYDKETGADISSVLSNWRNPVFEKYKQVSVEADSCPGGSAARSCFNSLSMIELNKTMLSNAKVIGQLDNKFIASIVEKLPSNVTVPYLGASSLLVLFDQHAVHERIRLEHFTQDLYESENGEKSDSVKCVEISPPQIVILEQDELRIMKAFSQEFTRIGTRFKVDESRRDTALITSIPACMMEKDSSESKRSKVYGTHESVENLIKEHICLLKSTSGACGRLPLAIHRILCSQACHGAVKFGDKLTIEECRDLLSSLVSCNLPFQCAHGRPSVAPLVDFTAIQQELSTRPTRTPSLWKISQHLKKESNPINTG